MHKLFVFNTDNFQLLIRINLHNAKKQTKILQILNEHESFAMYFIGGAADERVAYPSIASVFCSTVKRFAPLLLALRKGPLKSETASGPFQNTIALFEMWSLRLKKEDLDSQAAKLTAESSGIHITDIPILGTNKIKK